MPTLEETNIFVERRARIGRLISEMTNRRAPLTHDDLKAFQGFEQELRALEDGVRHQNDLKYAQAFRRWMRFGLTSTAHEPEFPAAGSTRDVVYDPGIDPAEREILEGTQKRRRAELRDMGVAAVGVLQGAFPGSLTGFFCPLDFSEKVENAMRSFACMLDVATPLPTLSGAVFPFPSSDDTSNIGEQIDENAQVTSADPLVGQVLFRSYKYSSKMVRMSLELLLDSGIDLDDYFGVVFGWRIGRILNRKFTVGVGGTSEPQGIVGAITTTVAAVGASENDGSSAGRNSIGSDDLANLELALDPAYRGGAEFMMHPTTLASLRRQRDKEGRPLWPGLHSGGKDTLLNYGVRLNVDLPQLQTQANSPPVTVTTVLFGQFSKYVWRKGPYILHRLREKYADYAQRGFLLHARADGQLLQPRAVVGLTNTF